MRVTTWTEYSLIISIHLAKRGRSGNGPVAARELADSERLRRAGLVESVRGAKGGYFLARDPGAISVRDVMSASERQTFEVNCDSHPVDAERCSPDSTCSIRPVWHALQQRVDELLASISLADLMKQESQVQELVGISSVG